MAVVGLKLNDRVYCLSAEQAQFLGGQLCRRVVVREPVAVLADELWHQSMLDPDREKGADIIPSEEQKRALVGTMSQVRPDGDPGAWDTLVAALRRELDE